MTKMPRNMGKYIVGVPVLKGGLFSSLEQQVASQIEHRPPIMGLKLQRYFDGQLGEGLRYDIEDALAEEQFAKEGE